MRARRAIILLLLCAACATSGSESWQTLEGRMRNDFHNRLRSSFLLNCFTRRVSAVVDATVDVDGNILDTKVASSSGNALFDQAARNTVMFAQRFPFAVGRLDGLQKATWPVELSADEGFCLERY